MSLLEHQGAMAQALRAEYEAELVSKMGDLHNRFVAFISSAQIPLPQVLLVLKMLERETLDQAHKIYLGD